MKIMLRSQELLDLIKDKFTDVAEPDAKELKILK